MTSLHWSRRKVTHLPENRTLPGEGDIIQGLCECSHTGSAVQYCHQAGPETRQAAYELGGDHWGMDGGADNRDGLKSEPDLRLIRNKP